jgi:hypothetical protein
MLHRVFSTCPLPDHKNISIKIQQSIKKTGEFPPKRRKRKISLTLPELLGHLVLVDIFITGLVARGLSPLVHLSVVLPHLLRLALLGRRAVGVVDLWLRFRRLLLRRLLLLRLFLLTFLRLFGCVAGVGALYAALGRSATAALAFLGWGWAGVLEVGGGVGALVLGVLASGVAFAGAVV